MKDENDRSIASPSAGGNGKIAEAQDLAHLSLSELHEALARADNTIKETERHGADGEAFKTESHAWRSEILRELERRWEPIRVDKESRAEAHQVPFPEAAWSGLFAEWREIVAPCTEAAEEKLWTAFLVASGLVLGRNIWIENPKPLYPNFYTMLIGQTADARKSTVLWLTAELLRRIGDEVEVVTGIVSTEGLFERLAKKEDTKALGYVDELRSLLSVARRKGTSDILSKLGSLYGCPNREAVDRREKSTTIVRPFFSLISATALGYVEDLLGHSEVAGGTLNRFLIVCGEEQRPKAIVKPPSAQAWERIVRPLQEIRDHWATNQRPFSWDPKTEKLWTEFYTSWRISRQKYDVTAANLTGRIFEHVQKIALVYSALSGQARLTPKALAIAISIGEWLQASTLRIFGHVGLDPLTKAEQEILMVLKRRSWMYRRDLQQLLSKSANGELFGRALKSLDANGFVKCYDGKNETPFGAFLGGQARPWVECVLPTPNTYVSVE